MPKSVAEDREDEVLALTCAALSLDGRTVEIEARPDRSSLARELTVDAILRVVEDGHDIAWAADVCLASRKFDPRLPAAMNSLRQILLPPLTDLATKVGRSVSVSCRAYVRLPGVSRNEWRRINQSYVRNVFDRVVMAFARPDKEWYDSEVGIHWLPTEFVLGNQRVMLQFSDPFIHESFRFSRAVSLKLTNQLKRASDSGFPTLLILDQKAPKYVDWITNIMPEPFEIGEVVAFLVAHHRASLSAGVLVEHDDSVHEIYRRVGKGFESTP
jgi:hypothetical protein